MSTPLFEPGRRPEVAPEDAVAVSHAFLVRCRAWATEREIPKLLARLAEHPTPADAARLHQWTTWRDFVDHALRELESGTLDGWFEEG